MIYKDYREGYMRVDRIDHLVLTVKDIDATIKFYTSIMGMTEVEFGEGRKALIFGRQKINLHLVGSEFEPKALNVKSGSEDLCFVIDTPIDQAIKEVENKGVEVIEGPIHRTGAIGKIYSAYFRDPDGNLIEISNYLD